MLIAGLRCYRYVITLTLVNGIVRLRHNWGEAALQDSTDEKQGRMGERLMAPERTCVRRVN